MDQTRSSEEPVGLEGSNTLDQSVNDELVSLLKEEKEAEDFSDLSPSMSVVSFLDERRNRIMGKLARSRYDMDL